MSKKSITVFKGSTYGLLYASCSAGSCISWTSEYITFAYTLMKMIREPNQ
jgi:hypothetical protein